MWEDIDTGRVKAYIYLPDETRSTKQIKITGQEYRRLVKVLRLKVDDKVILFGDIDCEYTARIKNIGSKSLDLEVLSETRVPPISGPEIKLIQVLPKGNKMDFIIKKGTELGISSIYPIYSSRSIVRYDERKIEIKMEHWNKLARESARQSRQTRIPSINYPLKWAEFLNLSKYFKRNSLRIMLWENEKEKKLKTVLNCQPPEEIFVLIGPEGGFSQIEANEAKSCNFIPVVLGRRILRTETASLAILSVIQFTWGEL
ncbi:MAG: 16S rRNA (uracil(1498)-N(3))-methyltransferase [Thermodesulfobacteriota bacterium]|nr:16S rRNA (uracil(1498)-N(3))-methyltransferase [Thermodesulfobacteriota bacterium]